MPFLPKRFSYEHIGAIIERAVIVQRRKELRKSASKRGYNSRWRKVSKLFLKEHPICECCECVKLNRLRTANVVHHIVDHKGNYDLFWDNENWAAYNKSCHDKHTARNRHG